MTDLRAQFDQMIDAVNRISLIEQLARRVAEAAATDKRECGNCEHWMKSRECPREHNVGGMTRGPSMSAPACDKFQIKQWVLDLKAERIAEAVELATKHNLPVPTGRGAVL